MLGKRQPMFYIQSTPPKSGVFVHHSDFKGLRGILNAGALTGGKKNIISLTTDPGRFLSPLSMFGQVLVDGFIEFPVADLITEGYAIPALYRTYNPDLVEWVKKEGNIVFPAEGLPIEYKWVKRFVCHSELLVRENEWSVLDKHLNLPDYKVYVHQKMHTKFLKGVRPHEKKNVFKLTDHPLWKERHGKEKVVN